MYRVLTGTPSAVSSADPAAPDSALVKPGFPSTGPGSAQPSVGSPPPCFLSAGSTAKNRNAHSHSWHDELVYNQV